MLAGPIDRQRKPASVAVGSDGICFAAESGGGRVVKLSGGRTETVLDGLQNPQGIAAHRGSLYVVDAGSKELIEYDVANKVRRTIASDLPFGAPAGVTPKFLGLPALPQDQTARSMSRRTPREACSRFALREARPIPTNGRTGEI